MNGYTSILLCHLTKRNSFHGYLFASHIYVSGNKKNEILSAGHNIFFFARIFTILWKYISSCGSNMLSYGYNHLVKTEIIL